FKFEHDLDNVRWAVEARRIDYPVAIDNDFEVWQAFANHYWPALYFVDAEGRIRHHRFGEGDYERSEMVIRQLLADAGVEGLRPGLASVGLTDTLWPEPVTAPSAVRLAPTTRAPPLLARLIGPVLTTGPETVSV